MAEDLTRAKVDRYFENHLTAENTEYVSEHNEKLLREFYQGIKGGRTKRREEWYLSKWKTLLSRFINSNREGIETEKLNELTRLDYSQILDYLREDEEKDYADNTIDDFKSAIRMFYKSRYMEFQRPDRVKEILQSEVMKDQKEKDKEKKRVTNILTPQQVWKLCEVAENPRDSLLPIFLLDCGARTEEVEERTIGDINKHQEYWEVTFHDCKNGKDDRELPLTHSQEKLRNWLEHHPDGDNPDAPLWVTLTNSGNGTYGEKMTQTNLNDILKRLAKRADLEDVDAEKLTVYDFRHSSATFRGTEKGWGIQQMMWWYAWKKPDRAKTYCEDNNDRMKKAILRRHGIDAEDEDNSVPLQPKTCPRCKKKRSTDAKYCPTCSLPLDTETAVKDSELMEAGRKVVEMKLDEKVDDEELQEIVEEVKGM